MGFFSGNLFLLADVAEIVAARPALWSSPLEVELQRLFEGTALPGSKITGKRSVRAKKMNSQKFDVARLPHGDKCNHFQSGILGKTRKRKRSEDRNRGFVSAAFRKELPFGFLSKIRGDLSGTDVKLVLEKELTASDINPNLGRFSLPSSRVLADFLHQGERGWLENGGAITLPVIEPCLGVSDLSLKSWKMSTKPVYVLNTGWNDLVRNNDLQVGDLIQVWSFRTEGRIGFGIVKCVDTATGDDWDLGSRRPPSPSSVLEFPPY